MTAWPTIALTPPGNRTVREYLSATPEPTWRFRRRLLGNWAKLARLPAQVWKSSKETLIGCPSFVMKALLKISSLVSLLIAMPSFAEISVGLLSKKQAAELGITMKHRANRDAGVMVWLEFKKEGFLEKFSYAELRRKDAKGKHHLSARLQPRPVVDGQPADIVSVAFSADPAELENCAFMIVAYGSSRGDVGYVLNVKDFIDLKNTPQFRAMVTCFNGRMDSRSSCSSSNFQTEGTLPLSRTNKLTCGHPGQASEIEWAFIERKDDKDVYRFTRRFPSDTPAATSVNKTVEFRDSRVVVFEDNFQAVVIEPPKHQP